MRLAFGTFVQGNEKKRQNENRAVFCGSLGNGASEYDFLYELCNRIFLEKRYVHFHDGKLQFAYGCDLAVPDCFHRSERLRGSRGELYCGRHDFQGAFKNREAVNKKKIKNQGAYRVIRSFLTEEPRQIYENFKNLPKKY